MTTYTDKYGTFFGRLTAEGNVAVFHDSGEHATRLDASVYPIQDGPAYDHVSARYERPEGIVLTREDAQRLGIEVEEV